MIKVIMPRSNETATSAVRQFSSLTAPDRRSVEMKVNGNSTKQISAMLQQEFDITRTDRSVREWFAPGGRLEQPYLEVCERLAQESVRDAKLLIRRGARTAAAKLIELVANGSETTQLRAAQSLAAKYLARESGYFDPDEDLPPQLVNEGEDDLMLEMTQTLTISRGE